jgi:serine acetyltransferase
MILKSNINKQLKDYKKIVIWGTGGLANTAINKWLPLDKIDFIIDGSDFKAKKFNGYDVYKPEHLLKNKPELILVCSSAYLEIFNEIRKFEIKSKYKYIYEIFIEEDKEYNELFNLYIDIIATKNFNLLKLLFVKPQILVNISFRIAKFIKNYKFLYPFYLILFAIHHLFCLLTSIQLPLNVKAGPGLIFAHSGTIVITGRAKLGAFVTIYHGCTIGTTISGGNPVIDNFVTIYTGSHILGASYLGRHSKVGAISLVLDFKGEEFSTITGIPAKTKKKY